ncbi:MAG TPA: N-acetylneuraminate synthase family protein [Coxiellaceae bacterium]|nr:N-acetylneuraminate synthase family protein [Coxiellaceae bacterium]
MKNEITFGQFLVGEAHPPLVFAEVGSYFNGDLKLAKDLVQRIIAIFSQVSHQPAVLKTEILSNSDICIPSALNETYCDKEGHIKVENYRALIERKCMSLEHYAQLFELLRQSKVPFIVSVYDFEAADFAKAQGASSLKIASANVVHIPLIRHVARLGLPMVIDTGRATLAEVFTAVDTARKAGCQAIIVQHSPDGHPALPEAHNLRILETYQQCFGVPVGLSDHYKGVEMLYAAIALGAVVLEKGIYTDPNELDQDIVHAMGIDQLESVLHKVYDVWQALGNYHRDMSQPIKGVIGSSQRQCLVAKKDLKSGDKINYETIRFAFPCLGIPVEKWDMIEGCRINKPIKANQPLTWDHLYHSHASKLSCVD